MELKFKNDKHFEESLVQALIYDHKFAEQMIEILNVEYFNIEFLKEIAQMLFGYYLKYKSFPSYKLLVTMVKNDVSDGMLKEQIIMYLVKIKKEPLNGDMEYVKETALDFCRKRSLAMALDKALSLMEEQKYDQIAVEVKKALQAGSTRTIGHDYNNDFETRQKREVYRGIATPWPEVNRQTQGGLGGGKLGVICAPTGVGKSHALVDIGAHAVKSGLNVIHYTFELTEIDIGSRYDARISEVSVDNLLAEKEVVQRKLEDLLKGRLIIKSFPIKTATVMSLKNHYNSVLMRGIKPDVIVVDYADLLKSVENFEAKRLNEEAVYEELRSWSMEINLPIWTATQTNREGLDVDVITLKHIAECFAKAMISDLFITMNRKKDSPTPEIGNFFIAKSRLGRDGIKFPMLINTGISKIEILSPDSVSDDDGEDDPIFKLREKFKKIKKGVGASDSKAVN